MAGRPRTTCPQDDELHKLGKELVEWAKSPDPDKEKLHINQWWAVKKGFDENTWECMIQKKVFLGYYKQAQAAISKKYIDGTINPGIAQRFIRLYFKDLREEENAKVKHDAEVKAKAVVQETQALSLVDIKKELKADNIKQE